MDNVVIYARYSSDRQTEQSIEGQLSVCQDFIKRNKYKLVGTYIDRAMSGTNDNRYDFQKMIKDSEKGLFKYIIVYKLDRFSRNRYDNAIYKATLKKNGVRVLSACEHITDSPEGIILESLLEGMAEYYSAELSQKIKRGQNESLKKKNNLGGIIPYGFKQVDKKLIIDEKQAIIVKEVFTLYSDGKTIKEITEHLKSNGVKNSYNRFFCHNSIMNMLKNKRYIGTYTYGLVEYENYLPAIIEKEKFEMVQEQLKIRKRKSGANKAKTNYLLSGKLYCGLCDSIMTGETGTSKLNIVYHYYKCSTKKRFHTCNKNTVKKEWIENLVLDETCKHIFKSGFYQKIIDTIYELYIKEFEKDDTLKILNSNKIKTQNEIQNLVNCYKMGLATKATQTELLELETQLENIEIEIKKTEVIKNNRLTRDHIEFMFEQYKDYDFSDEKKNERFIDAFVQKVILYEDKVIIVYNYTGDNKQEIKKSETEEISKITTGSDLSQMVVI